MLRPRIYFFKYSKQLYSVIEVFFLLCVVVYKLNLTFIILTKDLMTDKYSTIAENEEENQL